MSIKDIVRRHSRPVTSMSENDEEEDKRTLLREIEAYQYKNRLIYTATAIATVVLVVSAMLLVANDISAGSSKLVPILSGAGIGTAALLEMMRRAGRDWAQAQLVLGAARVADRARLQALIDLLLKP